MRLKTSRGRCAGLAAPAAVVGAWPVAGLAHSFGQVYRLPVPIWLYLYGAAAALALSFVVIAYFATGNAEQTPPRRWNLSRTRAAEMARRLHLDAAVRLAGVLSLLLCLATGFFGTDGPYVNFSMTFFWIVFVLGVAYLSALVGGLYALANPWRTMAAGIDRVWGRFSQGRVRYPAVLGYWPALAFYMAFIEIELFGGTGPFALAVILSVYTGINVLGVGLIGAAAWFRYCELFSVFFALIARMAPLQLRHVGQDREKGSHLQMPFSGLLRTRAERFSLLLFILFMLSSTAFDGLHETVPWRRLFWVDTYRWVLADWVGGNPFVAFPAMFNLYRYWQILWLLLSPLVYLAVYLLFITLMKLVVRSRLSVYTLALRFAFSLLPIALVYNISHYYTLIQTQGVKIVRLASDPFGRGWDLLGTGDWLQRTIVPDPATVWHVQVGLIVFGHVVSVYIAHRIALRTFNTRGRALVSQLPMLALMVAFTVAGLWILAQPIQTGG